MQDAIVMNKIRKLRIYPELDIFVIQSGAVGRNHGQIDHGIDQPKQKLCDLWKVDMHQLADEQQQRKRNPHSSQIR